VPKVLGLATLIGAAVFAPQAALASCIEPPPLPDAYAGAEAVFSGTVDAVDMGGRLATVTVDLVWKGEVADEVQVQGTDMLEANMITSVDRTYQPGFNYVFFVTVGGVGFKDNACTLTQETTADVVAQLDEVRGSPGSAPASSPTEAEPETSSGLDLVWVAFGAGVALMVVGAVIARRRRRPEQPEVEGFRLRR
jgi:hypothetical protein